MLCQQTSVNQMVMMIVFQSAVFPSGSRHDRCPGLLLPGKPLCHKWRASPRLIEHPFVDVVRPDIDPAVSEALTAATLHLTALLHRGDLRVRKYNGRNSSQRRDLSNYGRVSPERRGSAKHSESHVLLWNV